MGLSSDDSMVALHSTLPNSAVPLWLCCMTSVKISLPHVRTGGASPLLLPLQEGHADALSHVMALCGGHVHMRACTLRAEHPHSRPTRGVRFRCIREPLMCRPHVHVAAAVHADGVAAGVHAVPGRPADRADVPQQRRHPGHDQVRWCPVAVWFVGC